LHVEPRRRARDDRLHAHRERQNQCLAGRGGRPCSATSRLVSSSANDYGQGPEVRVRHGAVRCGIRGRMPARAPAGHARMLRILRRRARSGPPDRANRGLCRLDGAGRIARLLRITLAALRAQRIQAARTGPTSCGRGEVPHAGYRVSGESPDTPSGCTRKLRARNQLIARCRVCQNNAWIGERNNRIVGYGWRLLFAELSYGKPNFRRMRRLPQFSSYTRSDRRSWSMANP
jgi:hypothetical protein